MFGGHTIAFTLGCSQLRFVGFFSCLLKWVNLSVYDSGQCLGRNITNAKETPILKNSKNSSHLDFPKLGFQPILTQQKGW